MYLFVSVYVKCDQKIVVHDHPINGGNPFAGYITHHKSLWPMKMVWLFSPIPSKIGYTISARIWTFQPRKAQKADPRNKASQTFCGTFSGTKVNPWNHPQILRPAGVRNLDLQPRKAQKADPRNKASQTFCGTFSGTKVNPWTHPHILRLAGVRNLDLSAPKSSKSGPPQVDKQPAPRTQTSASALTGRECQCAVLNVLLFQPPLRTLPQSLLGQERISGHVRLWLAPPPPPILLSSHLPEDCIWEKAICQKNASEKKPSARRMEEWHLRKGLNSNLILLIHAQ